MVRQRFRQHPTQYGFATSESGDQSSYSWNEGWDYCSDYEQGKHGRLFIEHFSHLGGIANGTSSKGRTLDNWPLAIRGAGHFARTPDVMSDAEASTKLLARTNPSAPEVDISVFIAELREVPSMLRDLGGVLTRQWQDFNSIKKTAKQLAGFNLALSFGWTPLVGDLVSFLGYAEMVKRRFDLLNRMRTRGNDIHKVKLQSTSNSAVLSGWTGEWGIGSFPYSYTSTRSCDLWGYAIWAPDIGFPETEADLLQAAKVAALGLNPARMSVAWNLIPWSWLIDWGVTVGDFLDATTNTYPSKLLLANLCKHRRDEVTCPGGSGDQGISFSSLKKVNETKERYPAGGATVTAHSPILTVQRMGILASLRARFGR